MYTRSTLLLLGSNRDQPARPTNRPSRVTLRSSVTPTKAPQAGPSRTPQAGPSKAPQVGPSKAPQVGPSRAPQVGHSRAPQAGPSRAPQAVPATVKATGKLVYIPDSQELVVLPLMPRSLFDELTTFTNDSDSSATEPELEDEAQRGGGLLCK